MPVHFIRTFVLALFAVIAAPLAAQAAPCPFPLTLAPATTCEMVIVPPGATGDITNAGLIDSLGGPGVQNNFGTILTLTNQSSGSIDGLRNDGQINTIINRGSIYYVDVVSTFSGNAFNNDGTIGSLLNDTGASIASVGISGDGILNGGIIQSLVNRGSIFSTVLSGIRNRLGGGIVSLTNEATGTIDGGFAGIRNCDVCSIGTLVNRGTIVGVDASITNGGIIGTLANFGTLAGPVRNGTLPGTSIQNFINAQGGPGAEPVQYLGKLPANYYIYIVSTTRYGQIVFDDRSGTANVGVMAPDPAVVQPGRYTNVIRNAARGDLNNVAGAIGPLPWALIFNGSAWDLVIGADPAATRASVSALADHVKGFMAGRVQAVSYALDHDCRVFDRNGVCISFQASVMRSGGYTSSGGILVGAVRIGHGLRVGAFVDHRLSHSGRGTVRTGDLAPVFGLFAGYSANADGTGAQARATFAYNSQRIRITRGRGIAGAETGRGNAQVRTLAIGGEFGWGFALRGGASVVTPYAGIRYLRATRGSYSEQAIIAGALNFPLSYRVYRQRYTTLTAGVRLRGMITRKAGYEIGAGLEHDAWRTANAYTGANALLGTTFAAPGKSTLARTRGIGSAKVFYAISRNLRIVGSVAVRGAPGSRGLVSATAGWQGVF